jgi:hypothetical protein
MMGTGIGRLAAPVVGWALPICLVIALIVLLNRRDGRRDRLLNLVGGQFAPAVLRRDVAICIESSLLTESGLVSVNMPDSSPEETQEVFARLSKVLPPQVGLVVRGAHQGRGGERRSLPRGKALRAPSVPRRGSLGRVAAVRGPGG